MKIKEYKLGKNFWDCVELECEKTGIRLVRMIPASKLELTHYQLIDKNDTREYEIMPEVFEIIKGLFV